MPVHEALKDADVKKLMLFKEGTNQNLLANKSVYSELYSLYNAGKNH